MPTDDKKRYVSDWGLHEKADNQKTLVDIVQKLEAIKNNQTNTDGTIRKIYDAVYDPNTGLFARVNSLEIQTESDEEKIEIRFRELANMQVDEKHANSRQDEKTGEHSKRLEIVASDVKTILEWKKAATAIAGWILGGIATGGVGLLIKLMYMLIVK